LFSFRQSSSPSVMTHAVYLTNPFPLLFVLHFLKSFLRRPELLLFSRPFNLFSPCALHAGSCVLLFPPKSLELFALDRNPLPAATADSIWAVFFFLNGLRRPRIFCIHSSQCTTIEHFCVSLPGLGRVKDWSLYPPSAIFRTSVLLDSLLRKTPSFVYGPPPFRDYLSTGSKVFPSTPPPLTRSRSLSTFSDF